MALEDGIHDTAKPGNWAQPGKEDETLVSPRHTWSGWPTRSHYVWRRPGIMFKVILWQVFDHNSRSVWTEAGKGLGNGKNPKWNLSEDWAESSVQWVAGGQEEKCRKPKSDTGVTSQTAWLLGWLRTSSRRDQRAWRELIPASLLHAFQPATNLSDFIQHFSFYILATNTLDFEYSHRIIRFNHCYILITPPHVFNTLVSSRGVPSIFSRRPI